MLAVQLPSHQAMRSLSATDVQEAALNPSRNDARAVLQHGIDRRKQSPQAPAELSEAVLRSPKQSIDASSLLLGRCTR